MAKDRRRFLALAAAAALVFAGCGDDAEPDADPAPEVGGDPAPPDPDLDTVPDDPAPPDAEPAPAPDDADVAVATTDLGEILVDADGLTLYRFDADEPGVSACEGPCLDAWPPLLADGEPTAAADVTAELATIERDDGERQVTVDGWPLYYFAADAAPGDTDGQGFGDIWWVVGPDGSTIE